MENKILVKYVTGFVLGDGSLSNLINKNHNTPGYNKIGKNKNSFYQLKQVETHLDYIEWQKRILENITGCSMYHKDEYIDKRGYKCQAQYCLYTKAHPFFTELRNRIYPNGVKIIDPHYMKLIDWETLATLYMDNGWIENKETKTKGVWTRVSIATMAYSYGDNKMLRDFLAERFNLHFDIDHKTARSGAIHYYLRNTKDRALYFLDNIAPYVLPSYQYKLSTRLAPEKGDDIV